MVFNRKEYMKEYRANNKEKIRKNKKKYDEEKKEEIKEYNKKHYEENEEYNKEYYLKNRDKILEKNGEWKKNNKNKHSNYVLKSNLKNPTHLKARNLARQITIPKGKLCVECNKELAVEKHHEDYDKPLKVVFVCKKCHIKLDKLKMEITNGKRNNYSF